MLEILSRESVDDVKAEFETLTGNDDCYESTSEYDQVLVQALLSRAVSKKDDTQLIDLISTVIPRHIGSIPIEIFLATRHEKKLLILFEGYENASNEVDRKAILKIFDCVLPDVRKSEKNDDDFVAAAKAWYLKNDHRPVNLFYEPCSSWPDRRAFFKTGDP